MELELLHFTHPSWLLFGLIIVVICALYLVMRQTVDLHYPQLTQFIDSHLLPFLLVDKNEKNQASWKRLGLWVVVWMLLVLALAGPRWSFREIEMFSKDQSLMILLDLSKSMNATDIKPSRLIRAKQKIEDLLSLSKGVKTGLIAFAADPHLITPITDDKKTVLHLLASLDTDLIHIQGSKLSPALEMADKMFEAEIGKNKAIIVISDGGFEDGSAIATAKKLADKGIVIHAMGVGTEEGAPLKDDQGNVIKKDGTPVLSKLERARFREIATSGKGRYVEADYADLEIVSILEDLAKKADAEKQLGKERIWDEHFYLFVLCALPVVLGWFRKEHLFMGLFFFFFTSLSSLDAGFSEYFKNREELGLEAFEAQDFEHAEKVFQDPYHKGIACYRAGKFAEAEQAFHESSRPEVACSSAYNVGNALVKQNKLKEALTAYEEVVERWPEHTKAQENLELIKKILEEQKPPPPQEQNKNKDQQDKQNKQENESKDDKDSSSSSNKDEEKQESKKDEKSEEKEEPRGEETGEEESENQEEAKQEPQQESKQEEAKESAGELENKDYPAENASQCEETEQQEDKSEQEKDANCWLNRLENDPKPFMRNKFYIETKKNGTTEGTNPW